MYLSTNHFIPPVQLKSPSRPVVQSILDQGSGELNEDVLLVTDNVFGVFDGATSLGDERFHGGLTGGLLAARIASRAFEDDERPLDVLAEAANRNIFSAQAAEKNFSGERYTFWSTSMAVVRVAEDSLEYCQSGDAVILLILKNGDYRVVTPDTDIDSETLQLWKDMPASEEGTLQEVLAEQIRKVRSGMNVNYGVLNGEPEAMNFLHHGCEDLAEVSDILLFTDGLYIPRENPGENHNWGLFSDIYRRGGLQGLHRHVRRLQEEDPDCRKYPRFKLHDDVAAVAISPVP